MVVAALTTPLNKPCKLTLKYHSQAGTCKPNEFQEGGARLPNSSEDGSEDVRREARRLRYQSVSDGSLSSYSNFNVLCKSRQSRVWVAYDKTLRLKVAIKGYAISDLSDSDVVQARLLRISLPSRFWIYFIVALRASPLKPTM